MRTQSHGSNACRYDGRATERTLIIVERCAGFLKAVENGTAKNQTEGCKSCIWWLPTAERCAFHENPANRNRVRTPAKQFNLNKTSEFLKKQGILPHLKGYYYLLTALEEMGRMPLNPYFHRNLYQKVAEKFETSSNVIERSINGAIKSAWLKGGLKDRWRKPPSPRTLLRTLADMVNSESDE